MTGGTVNISGLTVRNCSITDDDGGGIWNSGTLTLTNAMVDGNSTTFANVLPHGGGIYNSGTLIITSSTVSNNTGDGLEGGGIYNSGDTLQITNSTVSDNSAGGGGGIYNIGGALTLINSTVSGNTVVGSGGGIITGLGATATITNSTVSGNTAGSVGGGMALSRNTGMVTITNSTISGNTAADAGGGIMDISGGTLQLTIINSTITNNSGGGVAGPGGTVTVTNSIVANQKAGADCIGTITSAGYNLESGTSCGFTGTGDLQNTDPSLGPLAYNGGPTQTHALLPGSIAIDAGDCDGGTITTDQRGVSRPQLTACDIGAYEYQLVIVTAVPTMTEWGMVVFIVFAGLGSVYYLRRRKRVGD